MGHRRVEDQLVVDLIADGNDVVLLAQVGDERELLAREDLSGGVVRRIDHDRPGPRRECRGELRRIKPELCLPGLPRRVKRHIAAGGTGHRGSCDVEVEEGLEDDEFVAGIEQGAKGWHEASRYATGDDDIFKTQTPLEGIFFDGLDEILATLGGCVGIVVFQYRPTGRLFYGLGYGEIRLTNTEIDGVFQFPCEVKNLADARKIEGCYAVGNHGRSINEKFKSKNQG